MSKISGQFQISGQLEPLQTAAANCSSMKKHYLTVLT